MAIRVVTSLVASAVLLSADTLVLRNGTRIEGSFVGGNSHSVRFASGDDIRSYELSDVEAIRFENGPPSQPPAPSAALAPTAPMPAQAPPAPAAPQPPPAPSAPVARQAPPPPTSPMSPAPPTTMAQQPPPAALPGPQGSNVGPTNTNAENRLPALEVPSGTEIVIRLIDPVNSEKDKLGQTYRASIDESVMVNGQTAIPRGANAVATLIDAQQSGKIEGRTILTLDLKYVTVNGQDYSIVTTGVSKASGSRGARSAKVIGAGTVLGAIIGAAAGGGKGAAIGAGSGAAAGTVAEIATSGQKVKVPAETRLTFTLKSPLDL